MSATTVNMLLTDTDGVIGRNVCAEGHISIEIYSADHARRLADALEAFAAWVREKQFDPCSLDTWARVGPRPAQWSSGIDREGEDK